jgi:protein-S-isoprenylcysteine O-methyltransferase Ste14
MDPTWRIALLAVFWVAWWFPFFVRFRGKRAKAVQKDNSARWGILMQAFGSAVVYAHKPATWASTIAWWRLLPALATGLPAIWLSWTATAHLGRQWRVEAGLNADHELIRSGPYRLVRHPIYASMLGMMLMSAALIGTWPGAPVGIVLFLIGIEIRVRIEDRLLAGRFGDSFQAWRNSVAAYIPFVH